MKNNTIINLKTVFATSILLLTTFSVYSVADDQNSSNQIIMTYSFDIPSVGKVKIGDEVYDRVTLQDLSGYGNPGEPCLPSRGANILLPQGVKVDDITISTSEQICLGKGFDIEPVAQIMPLSQYNSGTIMDEEIYNSTYMFPGEMFEEVGTYCFRGYKILVLNLNPVQYIPFSGELFYYEEITISISCIDEENINPLFRGLSKDRAEIIDRVDNPNIVQTYKQPKNYPLDSYDLLIITTDSLKDDFELLKNVHEGNGISTIIKTTTDVGSNNPDDIRNYITNAYNNWGIEYVLIGADDDIIPAKDLCVATGYIGSWVPPWAEIECNMPADIYYACLDGPYNNDGDDKWGEPNDGAGGGDVDLVAEVYVGRACVDSASEVNNFIDKTISYMYSNDDYLKDVLMVGEFLDFGGVGDWGGNYMDELIDGSSANGYTTIGISSSQHNIDTLYDRDWSGNDWPKSEIISRINDDLHFINHLGHTNYVYNMKMGISDVSALTNDKYCFIYSQGCMSGGFDNPEGSDCIAEYFTVKTDNAAFAVIMNARYGYGTGDSTDGPSQRYHREYWDAVFGEGKTQLGKANHDSKEDNLYRIGQNCMRWCYYELNLFGDPVVDLLNHYNNNPPYTPDTPSGPETGNPNTKYTYSTSTSDAESHQIYYKWDWDDGSNTNWVGPYDSGETIEAEHDWATSGEYEIKVKAKDAIGDESDWAAPLTVTIENNPPNAPTITGPTSGSAGTAYNYDFTSTDLDGNDVKYYIDWGDGDTEWTGFSASGIPVVVSHTWGEEDTYTIRAKAKDIFEEEGEWATLEVVMPINYQVINPLLQMILERFPNAFPILRYLLGL